MLGKYILLWMMLLPMVLFAQKHKVTPPIGHTSMVYDANFSPDGQKVVTASFDQTAKIWDVESGLIVADLKGHTNAVYSAEFSSSGKNIVTAGKDHTARIWNAITGIHVKAFITGDYYASFTSDANKVISYTPSNSSARIWNADAGDRICNLLPDFFDKGLPGSSYAASFAFSKDGAIFVESILDSGVKIWDIRSQSILGTIQYQAHVLNTFLSTEGKTLLTFSVHQTPTVWDIPTGSLAAELIGQPEDFGSAVFSPDGTKILTITYRRSFSRSFTFAKLWDARTGLTLAKFQGHTDKIVSAHFSPDSRKIVTASFDNTAKVWSATTGLLLVDLKGHSDFVNTAKFSPDGKKVVSASNDGTAKIWDADYGLLLKDLKGRTTAPSFASFSPGGNFMITSSRGYLKRIWNSETGKILEEFRDSIYNSDLLGFSPDFKMIVTQAPYPSLKIFIWDATAGKMITRLKSPPQFATATFLPGNQQIVLKTGKAVTIWETNTGTLVRTLKGHKWEIFMCRVSPDGEKIVTASKDSTAKIWDVNSGQLLQTLKGHKNEVLSAIFSSDGRTVLTASRDNTAIIWNVDDGSPTKIIRANDLWVSSAYFSPDGKKIIIKTFGSAGAVGIFDYQNCSLLGYLPGIKEGIDDVFFSPDGSKIAVIDFGQTLNIWELNTRALKFTIREVFSGSFSPDGKRIVTCSRGNTVKTWDAETGDLIYTNFVLRRTDYLNLLPIGYYYCTPDAARLLHYVTDSLEVITFEQLDIRYNRPDKAFAAIGCQDTALIGAYFKAYLKRIDRLKFDTSAFSENYSVPVADISNKNALKQFGDQLAITIKASDKFHFLDRFNVWINKVPVYGSKGVSLKKSLVNFLDTTVTVTLSKGLNQIEISVINSDGVENYHKPILYNNTDFGKRLSPLLQLSNVLYRRER